ncbi:MAG: PQQ-like beta-propeller repeat protein, partial [Planctomycetes bacterium]|nr:PQQ-like beta-propeller repeat protein [Planctomycetota bacterium]
MIEKKVTMTNRIISSVVAVIMVSSGVNAADWPTHLHDNHRSGFTTEQLQLPLRQQWVITTNRPPRPAWSETPAQQDFWQNFYGNKPRVPMESAFRVAVAGNRLYYGSSSSDKVVCRTTIDGSLVWRFIAGGPVRFAPTVSSGRIYFGSDDGHAYCLDAGNGQLIWKHRPDFASKTMMISPHFSQFL